LGRRWNRAPRNRQFYLSDGRVTLDDSFPGRSTEPINAQDPGRAQGPRTIIGFKVEFPVDQGEEGTWEFP